LVLGMLAKSVPDLEILLTFQANPNTRVSGTLSVDGTVHKIDPKESFALFERQWGNFGIGKGYYLLWLFLKTGEVLCSWSLEPELDGTAKIAFASIWHPNGLHEMIPVGPNSKAEDISISSKTGVKYFNKFFLDLPARDASFTFTKWIREAEITPTVEQRYIIISESYGEGTARFNGRDLRVHGHVEQLSTLR